MPARTVRAGLRSGAALSRTTPARAAKKTSRPPAPRVTKKEPLDKPTEETEPCSICMDELASKRSLSFKPCGHSFHRTCAIGWLESRENRKDHLCPLCRQRVEHLRSYNRSSTNLYHAFGNKQPSAEYVLKIMKDLREQRLDCVLKWLKAKNRSELATVSSHHKSAAARLESAEFMADIVEESAKLHERFEVFNQVQKYYREAHMNATAHIRNRMSNGEEYPDYVPDTFNELFPLVCGADEELQALFIPEIDKQDDDLFDRVPWQDAVAADLARREAIRRVGDPTGPLPSITISDARLRRRREQNPEQFQCETCLRAEAGDFGDSDSDVEVLYATVNGQARPLDHQVDRGTSSSSSSSSSSGSSSSSDSSSASDDAADGVQVEPRHTARMYSRVPRELLQSRLADGRILPPAAASAAGAAAPAAAAVAATHRGPSSSNTVPTARSGRSARLSTGGGSSHLPLRRLFDHRSHAATATGATAAAPSVQAATVADSDLTARYQQHIRDRLAEASAALAPDAQSSSAVAAAGDRSGTEDRPLAERYANFLAAQFGASLTASAITRADNRSGSPRGNEDRSSADTSVPINRILAPIASPAAIAQSRPIITQPQDQNDLAARYTSFLAAQTARPVAQPRTASVNSSGGDLTSRYTSFLAAQTTRAVIDQPRPATITRPRLPYDAMSPPAASAAGAAAATVETTSDQAASKAPDAVSQQPSTQ